jgi:hypothetical protein
MFASIRRAWKQYLASIPSVEEDSKPLSNAAILRELADLKPHTKEAFLGLARIITAHLSAEVVGRRTQQLSSRLKPGATPSEALSRWITAHHGPKSDNLGVIAVDWKARDEIQWQAERLAKAHHVGLHWVYDPLSDTSWEGWQARNEVPVIGPLRSLARELRRHELTLYVFQEDDTVCAFATPTDKERDVFALCQTLGIAIADEASPLASNLEPQNRRPT